jgi:low affinity Fe/Cu permease
VVQDQESEQLQVRLRRITHRTQQLTFASRILYRIEHYGSLAGVALAVPFVFVCLAVAAAGLGFPNHWVAGFEVGASTVTLIMVFTIQHTQTREQAATQRKLDELLRAIPGAAESLMMLEEAPEQFIREIEEDQRAVRSELVEDNLDEHFT